MTCPVTFVFPIRKTRLCLHRRIYLPIEEIVVVLPSSAEVPSKVALVPLYMPGREKAVG